jgi:hypothetical protein
MLEKIILKAGRMLIDAQQKLSAEPVAAVEQMYNDIVALNDFINKKLSAVESNSSLDAISKKAARRGIFEQAGRKLEVIKSQKNYSALSDTLEGKLSGKPVEEESEGLLLQFLREKEVRDRLFTMTETQILSVFGESLFDGTNPLLLKAILNSPDGFEPLSKETLKKMKSAGAGKISPVFADQQGTERNVNFMVEKMFNLVKKELDRLRQKELPSPLSQSKNSKKRPFKF